MPLAHIPQLVITGHGSIDDPEGDIVYRLWKNFTRYAPSVLETPNG